MAPRRTTATRATGATRRDRMTPSRLNAVPTQRNSRSVPAATLLLALALLLGCQPDVAAAVRLRNGSDRRGDGSGIRNGNNGNNEQTATAINNNGNKRWPLRTIVLEPDAQPASYNRDRHSHGHDLDHHNSNSNSNNQHSPVIQVSSVQMVNVGELVTVEEGHDVHVTESGMIVIEGNEASFQVQEGNLYLDGLINVVLEEHGCEDAVWLHHGELVLESSTARFSIDASSFVGGRVGVDERGNHDNHVNRNHRNHHDSHDHVVLPLIRYTSHSGSFEPQQVIIMGLHHGWSAEVVTGDDALELILTRERSTVRNGNGNNNRKNSSKKNNINGKREGHSDGEDRSRRMGDGVAQAGGGYGVDNDDNDNGNDSEEMSEQDAVEYRTAYLLYSQASQQDTNRRFHAMG